MAFINASMTEVPTELPKVHPGIYSIEIEDTNVEPNSAGDGSNLVVTGKIATDCEDKGKQLKKWVSLKPFANDKTGKQHLMSIKRLFLSAGFTDQQIAAMGDSIDTALLHGKIVRGVAKAGTYTPKGGGAPRETVNWEDILIPGDKGYQVA